MKIQLPLPLMLLLIIAVHATDCPAQERDRIDSLNNHLYAPPTETSPSISDWMMEYSTFEPLFVTYQNNTQQKLYVQTDKSFYSAGEKIWFTGFLVESIGHIPVILDQYINVDLYSPDGLIVTNQIIRHDSTGFNGSITLPADLQEGHYILRAYSRWMVKSAPDFLFHKTIRIGNKILTDIQTEIAYEKQPDANRRMKIRFVRNNKEPMNKKKIRCELFSDNKPDKTFTLRTDKEGRIEFDLPTDTDKRIKRVVQCTIEDAAIEFSRRIVIPPADFDFDVSFHPEGGDRLNGVHQTVAFKAISNRGTSLPIKGVVVNQKGDTICLLNTEHDGMGSCLLYGDSIETLHALVSGNGIQKQFPLPAVKRLGAAICVKKLKNDLVLDLKITNEDSDSLTLLGHTRGDLWFSKKLPAKNTTLSIPTDEMTGGILHLLLLKGEKPISERLFFIPPPDPPHVEMNSLHGSFNPRTELNFVLKMDPYHALDGWYAMSVTDGTLVEPDTINANIRSHLFLTSDLKGYVENPNYYLNENTQQTQRHADLLMMTHGWRRFSVESWEDKERIKQYIPEISQQITGRVENRTGKGIETDLITIFPYNNSLYNGKSDKTGYFRTEGLDIPDSTLVVMQAEKKNNTTIPILTIDTTLSIPPLNYHFPIYSAKESAIDSAYLDQALASYYEEGGISSIILKETVITGSKREQSLLYPINSPRNDDLPAAVNVGRSIRPGAFVAGNQIRIRGTYKTITDAIPGGDPEGGMPIPTEFLSGLSRGGSIVIDQNGNASVAMGRRSKGKVPEMLPNLKIFMMKGYERNATFYSPKYEKEYNNSVNDRRTTLLWNPDLLFDENGEATVTFFTADRKSDYRIIMEGVTRNGEILHFEQTIK